MMQDSNEIKQYKITKYVLIIYLCILILTILFIPNLVSNVGEASSMSSVLGGYSLVPIFLTIVVAFLTSDIIMALLMGVILSALAKSLINGSILSCIQNVVVNSTEKILAIANDIEYLEVILLCFVMAGFINVIKETNGYEILSKKIVKKVNTPRKAKLMTQGMAFLMFFDDYANAMLLGNVMKSVTDRVKVSREKLAYLVDSSAAPITGISVISSWVGMEIMVIKAGLDNIGSDFSAYDLFIKSIPYSFYCIFTIMLMLFFSLSNREIGLMYKCEVKARKKRFNNIKENNKKFTKEENRKAFTTIFSIIIFIISSLYFIVQSGYSETVMIFKDNAEFTILDFLLKTFSNSDTVLAILEASSFSAVVVMCLNVLFGFKTIKETINDFIVGASNIFSTVVVLVLAWALSDFASELGALDYVVTFITASIPRMFIPLLIFAICCMISFVAGSYGCLALAMPLAISVAYAIDQSTSFLVLCIGQVLAGSIFGDHCSPITDCTVMASNSCEVKNTDHVNTQLPYAMVAGMISVMCILISSSFNINILFTLLIGLAISFTIVMIFGKDPDKATIKNKNERKKLL